MKPKILLIMVFSVILIASAIFLRINLTLTEAFILGFAVIRLTRTISFNTVMEPFRRHFTQVLLDDCGAGDNVHPRGKPNSIRHNIGELISCPICVGQWVAVALIWIWAYAPVVVYIFAIAGISEMFHWLFDLLEWHGREARCISGHVSPDRGHS